MEGSYGERVRRYRVAAGLTQEELAAQSGLGVRTISDIERGQIGRPHRSTVELIARALDRDDLAYNVVRAILLTKARSSSHPLGTSGPEGYPGGPELRPVLDIFPVAIGHYSNADLAGLDVEARVGQLVDVLAPFGGQHRPWRHPARDRGADAVQQRLREWVRPLIAEPGEPFDLATNPSAGSSVLYWVGHGWSDGTRVALAHSESPAVVGASGLEPQQLAQAIRARQAAVESWQETRDAGGWVMVIIETSHATQISDAVMTALHGPDAPGRLLLVAVPDDGGIEPGRRFVGVLANLLADTYRTERRILLRDLAAQLERVIGPRNVHQRTLGEAAMARTFPPVASWMLAPVDTIRYLEDVLADLSPDERSHFVVKAQGAEDGELSWFFEGRENELAQITAWLRQASSGLLVVTGRAGSGKSALLGTVLVRSLPVLRDALARRGLAVPTGPGAAMPPESVFDAVIHLSGLHLADAVTRTAGAAGIGPLPSLRDPEAGVASDLDFLAGELAGRAAPFTVLADALDESLDPLDIARSLLSRLASLSCVRILVGTRASTSEAPDAPAGDHSLLDALGAGTIDADAVIWIGRDRNAIRRYVTGRLRAARDFGVAGRAVPYMDDVNDQDIQRVAAEIAHEDQEFLFARLAVYELIADPRLLTQGMARSRGELLRGTHQQVFGRALQRLASHDDHYPVLMAALSLAHGRGLPEADGIWTIIATALASSSGSTTSPDFSKAAAWATAISGLLSQAAAYITADTSRQRDKSVNPGTVYRFAHRTFVEYFARHSVAGPDSDPRRLTAGALLDAADAAASGSGRVPDYLVKHLSGHVAESDMWDDLANRPQVLDRIDPNAVTADAIRTLFGRRAVPPPIAGIIAARDLLADASPADRPGLRQLATAIHSPSQVTSEPVTSWGVAASQAGRSTVHVSLNGHTSAVIAVISLTLSGGRVVLASCGDDGTIRLWDPVTATPVGMPMKGHTSTIEDICHLSIPGGRTLLAGAGDDGTVRLWDPATGRPVGPVITGHAGPVWSLCTMPGRSPGQSVLVSAGSDGTVRLWDPATGQSAGPVITAPGPILGACVLPGTAPGQPPILVSGGEDGTVRLWDAATGRPVGPTLTAHAGPVWSVCVVPGGEPGHPSVLASAESDGTIRLWDPATGWPAGPVITAHAGPVWSMCVVPGAAPGRLPVLASGGEDGEVRLWDLATGRPAGPAITAHAGGVLGLCVLAGTAPGQPVVLASAGSDGTVRLWDLASVQPADSASTAHSDAVVGVCVARGAAPGQPPVLASAGRDGTIRLWDPATGQPAGPDITAHPGAVLGMCMVPGAAPGQPSALASAGRDGTIRLWDPATGQPAGPAITALESPARNICIVPGAAPGQPAALASAGLDGTVRLWDPATGQPAGPDITAHAGGVFGVCVLPGAAPGQPSILASAGLDGMIRLWDPATGQPAGPDITAHTGPVWGLCAVPGPEPGQPPALASAGEDGTIRLWDLATGQPAGPDIIAHAGGVLGVCVLPGVSPGQRPVLASAGSDGTVRLWDVSSGQPAGPAMTGHAGHVRGVCVLLGREPGQPHILASGGLDGTVRLWHAATGRAIGEPLVRSARAVTALARCTAAAGDCLTMHGDGTVRTWTAATAALRGVSSPPGASAIATLDGTDHLSLLTGDSNGRVHLTELRTGHLQGSPLRVDQRAVLAVCQLPTQPLAARFAVAGGSGTVTIITIRPGGKLETGAILRGASSPIRVLCAITDPSGQLRLAAAGNEGKIWLWDLTSLRVSPPDPSLPLSPAGSSLTGHEGQIWSLADVPARPDGSAGLASAGLASAGLASAGADGTVRLWDPVTGRALGQPLTGHTDQVRAVTAAISNDGCVILVSGGQDGTVRLWDPVTGVPHAVIPLGIGVHALLQQRPDAPSLERTGGGATIVVGLRTGVLALDLHRDLFEPQRA